jgi:predicted nucleotide-binding protein
MLQTSQEVAGEALGACIEQGRALIERATLIGDGSDFESWKADHSQWIEMTQQTLRRLYPEQDTLEEFRKAAAAFGHGRPWQLQYRRDSMSAQTAIELLVSLQQEHVHAAGESDAPDTSAEQSPAGQVVDERLSDAPATQEATVEMSVTHETVSVEVVAEASAIVPSCAESPATAPPAEDAMVHTAPPAEREPIPEHDPAPEPEAVEGLAATPAVSHELTPVTDGTDEPALTPFDAARFVKPVNGSASSMPVASVVESATNGAQHVFLVHGRNETWKHAVNTLLQQAGSYDITILNDRPDERRALVASSEEAVAHARYAVVLLTADDVASPRVQSEREPYVAPRARQAVVFELGVLVAVLSPQCICVLYEEGVELPCDLDGMNYVHLDAAGTWRSKLLMQMRSAGFDYDLNALAAL